MKLLQKDINKENSGYMIFSTEESDDMWHLYNLISIGDLVSTTTERKIQSESSSGSTSNEKIKVTLEISVVKIDFDSILGEIRLNGTIETENKYVKKGAYHTLELRLKQKIKLTKAFWDSISLKIAEAATDPKKYSEVGAIIMSEGLAHICLLTSTMTIERNKIELPLPKKGRISSEAYEKKINQFFEMIVQSILRNFDFSILKCIIIASPGFVKEQFFKYLIHESQVKNYKIILENKEKFLLVPSPSGHKHCLKEILNDPQVSKQLENTKTLKEVKALQSFFDIQKESPDRTCYGIKHIEKALDRLAIQILLITDELFRSSDLNKRKKYVNIVENVEINRGQVFIFSTMHISGEQLSNLGGIAAILKFPLPELDEDEDEDNNEIIE